MKKKGALTLIPTEIWGVIRAFALVLVIAVVFTKIYFLISPEYKPSKDSLERLSGVISTMEDGDSRSVIMDLEKGVWLFGFNQKENSVEYRRTVRFIQRQTISTSKPRQCPIDKACLCLCTDECKRVIECKVFDDIELFVVTGISNQLNGGKDYDDREGSYLAMPGKGINQIELWREDDIIYIGQGTPGKGQAREEFERFVAFANNNIGERKIGTCKLVFEIDAEKLTEEFYLTVYADGNATLFSGEGEQRKDIATQAIKTAPILRTSFRANEIDQIFKEYGELPRSDFIIPFTVSLPDPKGVGKDVLIYTVVLIQRDGNWIWTKQEPDFVDKCE